MLQDVKHFLLKDSKKSLEGQIEDASRYPEV